MAEEVRRRDAVTEREHVTPEEERQLREDETFDDLDVPEEQGGDVTGGLKRGVDQDKT